MKVRNRASIQRMLTRNAFCPTGEGGGIDPTCSPTGSSAKKDVENYAKKFSIGKVSYRGLDADMAQQINDSLDKLYGDSKTLPKLYGIEAKKFNGARGLLEDAPMAYAGGSGTLYINTAIMGNKKKFSAYQKSAAEAEGYVKDRLAKGNLTPEQKAKAQELLSYPRQLVDPSLDGMVTHEFGHHLDYKRLMSKEKIEHRNNTLIGDWKSKAKNVSARSADNAHEYIAESYVAHKRGMKIDDELAKAFNDL